MRRRRRDSRPTNPGHGTARERAEFRQEQRFIEVLQRLQLSAAAVMLLGLTISTLVCAGEFKLAWLVWTGWGIFGAGLVGFALARPVSRWITDKE